MKRMQLNDSVKRRRSSPIKTSTGSSGDAALRPTLVAFPVTSSSELTSDIPRSVSHDPHVVGLPPPMSTSASRTPSANSAFLQQNSELKNQQRLSGSWAPEVGCDQNSDEAYRQQDRYPSTEMERNNSPKRCPTPWRNDDGGENGNAADKRPSLTTSAEIRDSTVHLKYGGYPEVILDGSKPPCTTVNAEKELDVENQSLVETVRIQGSGCGRTGDSAGHGLGQRVGFIEKMQVTVHGFIDRNRSHIFHAIIAVFVALFYAYLFFAVWYYIDNDYDTGILPIVAMTVFVMVVLLLRYIGRRFGDRIEACVCWPFRQPRVANTFKYFKWCFYLAVFIGLCVFVAVDIGADVKRLTSLGGMAIFLTIGFLTSTNPSKVRWRPVLWGLGLQFVLGVLILRWQPGYEFFRIMGDGVRVFLEYADEGSKFVFGEEGLTLHPMAFKVFPIIIYFSAVINIFYYWGLMQFVVCKIAWLMQFTMGTTAIESLNAACNIFIGMAESCVIMRPFLPKLTKSELHAVMTGGFATVAGSYIALLIQVGASPEHLLSAAIMSAPAALAMAKLSYPETEISHTRTEEDVKIENLSARNMVEAASNGAISAIKVVSSVAANLIALLGLIAFLDAALLYIGNTVGIESLSFKMMCSYIFWPLAVIMGVEIDDAFNVARLIGVKIFADEFISFQELATMVCDKSIQDRSMVIATYACCGFGSIAAIGVYIGAMISVAPERRGDITEVAFRAVVNGNVAGFLTACIAGILYTGSSTLAAPGAQAIGCASNATLLATMNVTMHGMAHA